MLLLNGKKNVGRSSDERILLLDTLNTSSCVWTKTRETDPMSQSASPLAYKDYYVTMLERPEDTSSVVLHHDMIFVIPACLYVE